MTLEEENTVLRERIAQLERALGCGFVAPPELNLTATQAIILGVLMAKTYATRDALMAAVYRDWSRDEPDPDVIQVFICRMRRKLNTHGVKITTRPGQGYLLDETSKARVRRQMNGEYRQAA